MADPVALSMLNATSAHSASESAHPHLKSLVDAAKACGPMRVAIAYPCDAASLGAAIEAARAGLIIPILVGPRARMEAAAQQGGLELSGIEMVETSDNPRVAAAQAATLCREGAAAALMKGSLHTDELLGAAVSRDAGLRGGSRASHAFVLDVPGADRPLVLTDCVVNIEPGLMEKRDIVQNAINFAHAIGVACPRVAILSAVENINPAVASTLDAAALCKMADRGQITGAILDGPLAYDNAVSAESAINKGIVSEVAGRPDIMLLPNLEAGNMLYKQLVYTAGAECAGLVLGMKVPIILTSRSDSITARITSCALAVLVATRLAGRGDRA
ncbi:bifunctional enoyl-CoA hydratase/phosphate acetyltransferase [Polaromonas sp.]|uniref:bifunctional enoyl-CoA hydratase/phosphate acetyltransferase n=1 Tax=Polaromonas sp. TaxID=1869339 RepID=UPI0013B5E84D|nr:bifunctional enoyl-CoA hydratase/phosphate acetyltransferase [Polaromonas sp.]NDP62282.1 bifunctional enoyl-CoA hydratase/phosphate acetyltransferase [Polaromonas sp.]